MSELREGIARSTLHKLATVLNSSRINYWKDGNGEEVIVLPLLAAVLMLLVVSGAARRLDGDRWSVDEAASGVVGGHPIIQFLKRLYLQQLSGTCPHDVTGNPNSAPACPSPP